MAKTTTKLKLADEATRQSCKRCEQVIMFRYSGVGQLGGVAIIATAIVEIDLLHRTSNTCKALLPTIAHLISYQLSN